MLNPEQQKELEWIFKAQEDPEAFRYLFERYYDPIFNYILRRTCDMHVAKDVTANTFLKALNHIKKFKWRGISFSAWLYKIATNEINQNYRKTKRLVHLNPEHIATLKSDVSSDSGLLDAEEVKTKQKQNNKVHAAIASLKLKYQTVLTLRYFENLSLKEIANILGMPENTVKTHIRRGLIQLKERL